MALVNQEAAGNGQPPVGFLNPALYALGKSVDYTNNFNDITVGNNATPTSGGLFPAVPGYDLCTGWGSPKGNNLIHSLALPQRLVIAPNSALFLTGPVGGPLYPSALAYSLTNGNGSLDWSLALDATWLTVSPTNGTLLAGGPNTIVAVTPNVLASNLAAGSYTATLFFTNLLDQSVQTRHITLAIVSLPLITSQPTNQAGTGGDDGDLQRGNRYQCVAGLPVAVRQRERPHELDGQRRHFRFGDQQPEDPEHFPGGCGRLLGDGQ